MAKSAGETLSAERLEAFGTDTPSLEAFAQSLLRSILLAAAEQLDATGQKTDVLELDCKVDVRLAPAAASSEGGDCVVTCLRFWQDTRENARSQSATQAIRRTEHTEPAGRHLASGGKFLLSYPLKHVSELRA